MAKRATTSEPKPAHARSASWPATIASFLRDDGWEFDVDADQTGFTTGVECDHGAIEIEIRWLPESEILSVCAGLPIALVEDGDDPPQDPKWTVATGAAIGEVAKLAVALNAGLPVGVFEANCDSGLVEVRFGVIVGGCPPQAALVRNHVWAAAQLADRFLPWFRRVARGELDWKSAADACYSDEGEDD